MWQKLQQEVAVSLTHHEFLELISLVGGISSSYQQIPDFFKSVDDQMVFVGSPPHTGQAGPAVVAPDAKRSCLVHWACKGTSGKVWSALQAVLFRGWKGMYSDADADKLM